MNGDLRGMRPRPGPGIVGRAVRTQAYQRTRVGIGLTCAVLGIAVIVRTFQAAGASGAAVPAYVMGLALVALGAVRLRDYRAMSRMAATSAEPDAAAKRMRPRP